MHFCDARNAVFITTSHSFSHLLISLSSELTKENRDLKKKRREIDKDVKNLESEHLKRGLLMYVVAVDFVSLHFIYKYI